MLVALTSTIAQGVEQQGSDAGISGYPYAAVERILKQGCAEFHSLRSGIDSQAGKDHQLTWRQSI